MEFLLCGIHVCAQQKLLYITPGMDFPSGNGVVRGRGGAGGSGWAMPCLFSIDMDGEDVLPTATVVEHRRVVDAHREPGVALPVP